MQKLTWAEELAEEVATAAKRKKPRIGYYYCRYRKNSSGITYYSLRRKYNITLRLGYDEHDQKLVLLHELAHWVVMKRNRRRGHDKKFWETAWELYHKYNLNIEVTKKREFGYKKKAEMYFMERGAH